MTRQANCLTKSVLQVLQQHDDAGVDFHVLAAFFPRVERSRISQTLSNLRDRLLAHSQVEKGTWAGGRWFFGPGTSLHTSPSPTERKRIERARQLDQYQPMTFYGEGLVAPRAASVWAYASYFQEHRA